MISLCLLQTDDFHMDSQDPRRLETIMYPLKNRPRFLNKVSFRMIQENPSAGFIEEREVEWSWKI